MDNKKIRLRISTATLLCAAIVALSGCSGSGGDSGIGGTGVVGAGDGPETDAPPFEVPQNLTGTVFDPASYSAVESPATFDGTWMLIEISQERFSDPDDLDTPLLQYHETSRQLVTITQSGDGALITRCNGEVLDATVVDGELMYAQPIALPATGDWFVPDRHPTAAVTLHSDAPGYLQGTLDTAQKKLVSEYYFDLHYRLQTSLMLVRVATNNSENGIGTLDLSWYLTLDSAAIERHTGNVSCFAESIREKADSSQDGLAYNRDERTGKKLLLATETLRVTFSESLYYRTHALGDVGTIVLDPPVAGIERMVTLEQKPSMPAKYFVGSFEGLSSQEENSFTPASPELARQQYTSSTTSLNGVIHHDHWNDEFVDAEFSLQW